MVFIIDPHKWSKGNVAQWLNWAVKEFGFDQIDTEKFPFSGAQLCTLPKEEFLGRAPFFTGDVLYSHLNFLKARSGE